MHGTRRYLVRRFPFAVIYFNAPDKGIYVVAVAHHSRQPGYWGSRTA